ncbi:uncharacterized protein LACBIDRAFT_327600 [Laccaria bicolor S238N-H82]|uniref:Predicted protein n=1 Tax=Laccaria bicolor (strain S238N-H82 / ATCC MYA-4686) TaxID=486041 RepID=B0DC82_LACBS|nr:uncharacterized protein LACBIDRAFT_327600 [Laccaria bicolor S238N-H82]EDR07684.1 predicted protein [Laccaria bicolor S238N-H82]|eukprot:XP_001881473.1 predicted protein [Laccaria bicolor S238N-H82]
MAPYTGHANKRNGRDAKSPNNPCIRRSLLSMVICHINTQGCEACWVTIFEWCLVFLISLMILTCMKVTVKNLSGEMGACKRIAVLLGRENQMLDDLKRDLGPLSIVSEDSTSSGMMVMSEEPQLRATPMQRPGKTKAPGKPCSFSTAGETTYQSLLSPKLLETANKSLYSIRLTTISEQNTIENSLFNVSCLSLREQKLLELLDLYIGEWKMPPAPANHFHFLRVSMGKKNPSDFGRRYFYWDLLDKQCHTYNGVSQCQNYKNSMSTELTDDERKLIRHELNTWDAKKSKSKKIIIHFKYIPTLSLLYPLPLR